MTWVLGSFTLGLDPTPVHTTCATPVQQTRRPWIPINRMTAGSDQWGEPPRVLWTLHEYEGVGPHGRPQSKHGSDFGSGRFVLL